MQATISHFRFTDPNQQFLRKKPFSVFLSSDSPPAATAEPDVSREMHPAVPAETGKSWMSNSQPMLTHARFRKGNHEQKVDEFGLWVEIPSWQSFAGMNNLKHRLLSICVSTVHGVKCFDKHISGSSFRFPKNHRRGKCCGTASERVPDLLLQQAHDFLLAPAPLDQGEYRHLQQRDELLHHAVGPQRAFTALQEFTRCHAL